MGNYCWTPVVVIAGRRADMSRAIFFPVFFFFLGISTINSAPQFSGQLKPFFNFRGFTVVANNGRDAFNSINVRTRLTKPSAAPLRVEPVVVSTTKAATTIRTVSKTTTTAPTTTASTTEPTTTTTTPSTTTVTDAPITTTSTTPAAPITKEEILKMAVERLKGLEDISDETADKLVVLDPIVVGETISVDEGPNQNGMNIVNFDADSV